MIDRKKILSLFNWTIIFYFVILYVILIYILFSNYLFTKNNCVKRKMIFNCDFLLWDMRSYIDMSFGDIYYSSNSHIDDTFDYYSSMNGPIGVVINYHRKHTTLCPPHYAKSQQRRGRFVHSKVGRFLSSGPEEVPKRAKESSITIGNKSKADAAIARRARRGGWPVSQLLPPRTIRLFSASIKRYMSPNTIVRRANFGFVPILLQRLQHDDFFQSDTTRQFLSKCLEE